MPGIATSNLQRGVVHPRALLLLAALGASMGAAATARAQAGGETARQAGHQRGEGQRAGFAGMQRVQGEVTAVDGATISLKAEDGSAAKVVTTDNTRIMRGNMRMAGPGGERGGRGQDAPQAQPPTTIKVADIKPGDGIMAAGEIDPATKTLHAAMVFTTDAAVVKAMRENWGKTFISGRVKAVDLDNAKITVERPDHTALTIGLDESTSFRRGGPRARGGAQGSGEDAQPVAGGESITLADVKVGDNVAGQGTVKAGVFVPSQLTVSTPGPRHAPGAAGPAQSAPAAPNR